MENQPPEDDPQPRGCNICRIYARILTNWYPIVCLAVILISGACGAVAFLLYDIPKFDDPTKGFEARGTPITTSLIALNNYYDEKHLFAPLSVLRDFDGGRRRRDVIGTTTSPPTTLNASTGFTNLHVDLTTRNVPTINDEQPFTQICSSRQPSKSMARLVFGAVGQNDLLTTQAIIAMCKTEEQVIRSHVDFNSTCKPCLPLSCPDSWSLGSYVALLSNKKSCMDINDTHVSTVRKLLGKCVSFYNTHLLARCAKTNDCVGIPSECIAHNAVYSILHYISPASFAKNIEKSKDAKMSLSMTFLPVNNDHYALEFIYLDNIHGKTFSDGVMTLKAVYFDIKYQLFETFLFTDIKYIGIGLAVILILLWIYTTSFLVMIAALINFILSLILAYFFYVVVLQRPFFPFVNITAFVLLIGIGADDTFVFMDLWRKALSKHPGKKLVVVVEDALRHATATMFVTSATTTAALFASMISNITAVKCFSLFTGLTIMMNFVLTLTWIPAVIILQHRSREICCKSNVEDIVSSTCMSKLLNPFRIFFVKILPFIVLKFSYVWLVGLTVLGICGAVLVFAKPGLKLPTSSEFQVLRSDNYLEQYDLVYRDRFNFESDNLPRMTGQVCFGIQSKYSGDPWNPDDYGQLYLDDSFEFSTPGHQLWLQTFCRELRNQSFYYKEGYSDCLIDSLKTYMDRDCFYQNQNLTCCREKLFPYSAFIFDKCLRECVVTGNCNRGNVQFSARDKQLVALTLTFQSTTVVTYDFRSMDKYWRDVNKWMDTKFETAPDSLSNVWFTSYQGNQLWFFDLQQSLAIGTLVSLGVTLALATVILICSILNIILALYAILSVGFVVFVTIGSLVLLGWELNIFESVIFTLAVGLSVDFTIHYGVAYSLAPFQNRAERTEFSVQTMGSAITIAAISTFVAGAIMMPSNINAYLQLGIFLMLVMSISWVYSTFFFQSLCSVFGPQGKTGQLNAWCKKDELNADQYHNTVQQNNPSTSRKSSTRVQAISGTTSEVQTCDMALGTIISNHPDILSSVT